MDKMLEELLAGLLMQQQGSDQAGDAQGAPVGGRGMQNLDPIFYTR